MLSSVVGGHKFWQSTYALERPPIERDVLRRLFPMAAGVVAKRLEDARAMHQQSVHGGHDPAWLQPAAAGNGRQWLTRPLATQSPRSARPHPPVQPSAWGRAPLPPAATDEQRHSSCRCRSSPMASPRAAALHSAHSTTQGTQHAPAALSMGEDPGSRPRTAPSGCGRGAAHGDAQLSREHLPSPPRTSEARSGGSARRSSATRTVGNGLTVGLAPPQSVTPTSPSAIAPRWAGSSASPQSEPSRRLPLGSMTTLATPAAPDVVWGWSWALTCDRQRPPSILERELASC